MVVEKEMDLVLDRMIPAPVEDMDSLKRATRLLTTRRAIIDRMADAWILKGEKKRHEATVTKLRIRLRDEALDDWARKDIEGLVIVAKARWWQAEQTIKQLEYEIEMYMDSVVVAQKGLIEGVEQ